MMLVKICFLSFYVFYAFQFPSIQIFQYIFYDKYQLHSAKSDIFCKVPCEGWVSHFFPAARPVGFT
jgi:hypothetical protein